MGQHWEGPSLRQADSKGDAHQNPFIRERAPRRYRRRVRPILPRRIRAILRLIKLNLSDITFLARYAAHSCLLILALVTGVIHAFDLSASPLLAYLTPEVSAADVATNESIWQSGSDENVFYLSWNTPPLTSSSEERAVARLEPIVYEVREGDNPEIIAQRFGLQPLTVIWANTEVEENPYLLALGQVLILPPVDGIIHTVRTNETIELIGQAYQVQPAAIIDFAGNNLSETANVEAGQTIIVPGGIKPDEPLAPIVVATSPTPSVTIVTKPPTKSPTEAPTRLATQTVLRATATRLPATSIPATATAIAATATAIPPTATFVPSTATFIPPTRTPPPSSTPIATEVIAVAPTFTRIPPTWTPIPPTWTAIPPTWTAIPPTWTAIPPTWTAIPPTWTAIPPTWTAIPPTWTAIPPTWTAIPPTWTAIPPTWTPIPPTWTPIPPTWTAIPPTWTAVPPPPTAPPVASRGSNSCCVWPLQGRITTQPSSWHMAIDILAAQGTPIQASGGGQIVRANWDNTGYGNVVIVDHGGGVTTLYSHLSSFAVSYGAYVRQGQIIGYVGATGRATAPHLHFEVRQNNSRQNPYNWLP